MLGKIKLAVVTGASRGIGEALALALLASGYTVYGLSRSRSSRLDGEERFHAIACDLSDTAAVESLADGLFADLAAIPAEELLLVNNAAMLEPIQPVEAIGAANMSAHLHTGFIAPLALSGAFIRHAQQLPIKKTIVNVTSGMATYAAASMSLYCSTKAALEMATRCIVEEQKCREHPVHAYALDPGMAETDMQVTARAHEGEDFPLGEFFRESPEQGRLWTAAAVAEQTLRMLGASPENGKILRVYEAV